jgi:hypothetical protein
MSAWPGWLRKAKFIGPEIRVIAFHVGIIPDMPRPRRRQRQEIRAKRAFVGGAIGPESPPRLPIFPEAFVVPHSVLDDESLDPVRMSQGHTKTHRAAVILHVERVAREPEGFSEVIHDLRVVIERIRKFPRFRPVAVSKARVIGRDKVIAIAKPAEQRLEHSRRRGQSVEQENRWGILRSCFTIKNRESVNFNGAIKDVLRHMA